MLLCFRFFVWKNIFNQNFSNGELFDQGRTYILQKGLSGYVYIHTHTHIEDIE